MLRHRGCYQLGLIGSTLLRSHWLILIFVFFSLLDCRVCRTMTLFLVFHCVCCYLGSAEVYENPVLTSRRVLIVFFEKQN